MRRCSGALPLIGMVPRSFDHTILGLVGGTYCTIFDGSGNITRGPCDPAVGMELTGSDSQMQLIVRSGNPKVAGRIGRGLCAPFFAAGPIKRKANLNLSVAGSVVRRGRGKAVRVRSRPGRFAHFAVAVPVGWSRGRHCCNCGGVGYEQQA